MSSYQYRDSHVDKTVSRPYSIGIPMLKIRRSHDRLMFNMGITIPGKDGLYIETGPWFFSSNWVLLIVSQILLWVKDVLVWHPQNNLDTWYYMAKCWRIPCKIIWRQTLVVSTKVWLWMCAVHFKVKWHHNTLPKYVYLITLLYQAITFCDSVMVMACPTMIIARLFTVVHKLLHPCQSFQLLWRLGTSWLHLRIPDRQISSSDINERWNTDRVIATDIRRLCNTTSKTVNRKLQISTKYLMSIITSF